MFVYMVLKTINVGTWSRVGKSFKLYGQDSWNLNCEDGRHNGCMSVVLRRLMQYEFLPNLNILSTSQERHDIDSLSSRRFFFFKFSLFFLALFLLLTVARGDQW